MRIYKFFFFFFSLAGFILIMTFTHENFHKFDFRDIPKENDSICYFQLGNDDIAGWYALVPEKGYKEVLEERRYKSEFKAYLTSVPILIIYLFCLFKFINDEPKKIKGESYYG